MSNNLNWFLWYEENLKKLDPNSTDYKANSKRLNELKQNEEVGDYIRDRLEKRLKEILKPQ